MRSEPCGLLKSAAPQQFRAFARKAGGVSTLAWPCRALRTRCNIEVPASPGCKISDKRRKAAAAANSQTPYCRNHPTTSYLSGRHVHPDTSSHAIRNSAPPLSIGSAGSVCRLARVVGQHPSCQKCIGGVGVQRELVPQGSCGAWRDRAESDRTSSIPVAGARPRPTSARRMRGSRKLGERVVRAALEPGDQARRDPVRPQHDGHGRREIFAMPLLTREQEISERIGTPAAAVRACSRIRCASGARSRALGPR